MNRRTIGKGLLVCCSVLAAGCGVIPDLLLDTARSSAREAVEQVVNEAVNEILGDLLDFENLPILPGSGSDGE